MSGLRVTLCTILCAAVVFAQAGQLQFDVVSIKPTVTTNPRQSRTQFPPGGGLRAVNVSLYSLIQTAYNVQDFQIEGGPDWVGSVRYDLEGTSLAGQSRDEVRLMLQGALATRFSLKVHRATKEVSAYSLVVGKGGPKLGQVRPTRNFGADGTARLVGKRTMAELAETLAGVVRRPVVDRTGLTGTFDLMLEWAPVVGQRGAGGSPTAELQVGSIFSALQEQLGLQLESIKTSVEFVVIDSVEKPTPN